MRNGWRRVFRSIKAKARLAALLWKYDAAQLLALVKYYQDTLGAHNSARTGRPVSGIGEALPWYTYPAIAYLNQLDFSQCDVFEYGSGNGSEYWANRGRSLTSVEADPMWYESAKATLAANQQLTLCIEESKFAGAIHATGQVFDVVVIDAARRYDCVPEAVQCLSIGGMIVLDNSDWYPNAAALLRRKGFTQIDFIGWGPINSYAWCTSLFISKESTVLHNHVAASHVLGGIAQFASDDMQM